MNVKVKLLVNDVLVRFLSLNLFVNESPLKWSNNQMQGIQESNGSPETVDEVDPESIVHVIGFPHKERELHQSNEGRERAHDSKQFVEVGGREPDIIPTKTH